MKFTQRLFYNKGLHSRKRLPEPFPVGERKFLPLQPPLRFLYHTRGKKLVNRGQGFKKIDWEHCNQEKEEGVGKMLNH